jgi:hypothetical protein
MATEEFLTLLVARIDATGQTLAEAADADPEKLGEVFATYKILAEAFFKTLRVISKMSNEVVMKAMDDIETESAAATH